MNPVRFYTDEHIARAVIRGLRARGIDVETVAEASLLGAADEAHLAHAWRERRVVVTQDDDFLRLASVCKHAGIVYAPQGTSVGTWVRGLVLIVHVLDADDLVGRVEFL